MLSVKVSEVFKSEETLKSNGENYSDKGGAGGGGAARHHGAGRADHHGGFLVLVGLRLGEIGSLVKFLLERFLMQ